MKPENKNPENMTPAEYDAWREQQFWLRKQRKERREAIRWRITEAIALAAAVVALLSLVMMFKR